MGKCFLKTTAALLFVTSFRLCDACKLSADCDVSQLHKETTSTKALRSIPEMSPMHERALQDANFTYTANYTAQFQYFRDVLCQGPAPVIQVACLGPNIRLLNTSDPSIVCSTPFIADNGWSTIECNNTCASDAACEGVYLNIGGNIQDVDGPYGKIRFECEGDELYTVDAYVAYLGGGNGACAGSSSGVDTHNFHVA